MKSIDINKKQKEMLLEMCKKLFPEYKVWYLYNNNILKFAEGKDLGFGKNQIHWFEFCHEYLVEKTLGDYNLIFCGPNRKHPVDYLYEEFKKLK